MLSTRSEPSSSIAQRLADLKQTNAQLSTHVASLAQQLEWFKRQLCGQKSEKRLAIDVAEQGSLLSALGVAQPPAPIEAVDGRCDGSWSALRS